MKKKVLLQFILVIMILLIAVSTSGCGMITQRVASMKPEIRGVSHQWGQVTDDITELITTVIVYNPNSFALPIKEVTGNINAAGIEIGNANSQDVYIGKNGEYPITILTSIDNSKIPDLWVAHVNNQEKSAIEINADIVFNLKISEFTYPYQMEQPLETDIIAMLYLDEPITIEYDFDTPLPAEYDTFRVIIKSSSGSWGKVTRDNTSINFSAVIQNDNSYPLIIPEIAYEIMMNEIIVAADEVEINTTVMQNSEETVATTISLGNNNIIGSIIKHIQNGESSTYQIEVSVIYEIPTGDELMIPVINESGHFETDILGSKADS